MLSLGIKRLLVRFQQETQIPAGLCQRGVKPQNQTVQKCPLNVFQMFLWFPAAGGWSNVLMLNKQTWRLQQEQMPPRITWLSADLSAAPELESKRRLFLCALLGVNKV